MVWYIVKSDPRCRRPVTSCNMVSIDQVNQYNKPLVFGKFLLFVTTFSFWKDGLYRGLPVCSVPGDFTGTKNFVIFNKSSVVSFCNIAVTDVFETRHKMQNLFGTIGVQDWVLAILMHSPTYMDLFFINFDLIL